MTAAEKRQFKTIKIRLTRKHAARSLRISIKAVQIAGRRFSLKFGLAETNDRNEIVHRL